MGGTSKPVVHAASAAQLNPDSRSASVMQRDAAGMADSGWTTVTPRVTPAPRRPNTSYIEAALQAPGINEDALSKKQRENRRRNEKNKMMATQREAEQLERLKAAGLHH